MKNSYFHVEIDRNRSDIDKIYFFNEIYVNKPFKIRTSLKQFLTDIIITDYRSDNAQ